MTEQPGTIDRIANARCLALTTFKRDATPVTTPIWFNVIDGKIYVTTTADAGKVKRIRNNPRVEFTACTQRGKIIGSTSTGTARVLSPAETGQVLRAKRRRYRTARLIQMLPGHRDQIGIEIVVG